MKSAQQGTFSRQKVVFLVDRLVLYQGRGLAVLQTGRDICSQNKSLSIYTREDRNDNVYLCAPRVHWLSAKVRKYYLPPSSAHRSSAENYPTAFQEEFLDTLYFFASVPKHAKSCLTGSGVLHSFVMHMYVNHLSCKTQGKELHLCYAFVQHWAQWELSGVLLLL